MAFCPNHITTGYSLRGRCSLKKAVEGLKNILVKGDSQDVEGIKFRVLDTRKNGIALDIEIEMVAKGDKGIAMVKLYGPYEKKDNKDNVVMITKSKQSESKFVTLLADKIIKPIISGVLDSKTRVEESSGRRGDGIYKCPFCEELQILPLG